MGNLGEALSSAFTAESSGGGETESAAAEPETTEAPAAEAAPAAETPAKEAAPAEEPEGEEKPLTPQEIAEWQKRDPRGYASYKRITKAHTQAAQERAELRRQVEQTSAFWNAIQDPQTRQQAFETLARTAGIDVQFNKPLQAQTQQMADDIEQEVSALVGPDAAKLLLPVWTKIAERQAQRMVEPLQKGINVLQERAHNDQADASVQEFRAMAKSKGWNLTPEVESKMTQIGFQMAPVQRNPVTGALEVKPLSAPERVEFLERCYRLSTLDTVEADAEKRVHERMKKAAETAEPSRGVPSTGREKRTAVTKDMSFSDAWDTAIKEVQSERGWR